MSLSFAYSIVALKCRNVWKWICMNLGFWNFCANLALALSNLALTERALGLNKYSPFFFGSAWIMAIVLFETLTVLNRLPLPGEFMLIVLFSVLMSHTHKQLFAFLIGGSHAIRGLLLSYFRHTNNLKTFYWNVVSLNMNNILKANKVK